METNAEPTVLPPGTVTVAGRAAPDPDPTTGNPMPPAGAGRINVTFNVDGLPPTTELGVNEIAVTATRRTTTEHTETVSSTRATTKTTVSAATGTVVPETLLNTCPAGTVTDDGTESTVGFSDSSSTTWPPVGALETNVTFNDTGEPPETMFGVATRDLGTGTNTGTWARRLVSPAVASTDTSVSAETRPASTATLARGR